ncbi:DNA mismatch repair protein MutS [Rufibacter sediminis]|uniref:DNA mismatch repair protein MutS n=1 Tax=Rufibacter sediminis TaxID=2762756 RepID=A0ABR6VYQ4_9BACT|nr:DNA mismatch repair protein MutS [Rufibacter sediminis]MBC3541776.1 DNA mismatch repair protein MutS [Rufibacter sediminis]
MKQYNAIKAKHPGALLLFRVGDFYETFGEDAIKASKILGIMLTKRGNGSAAETALAGFPHHSLDTYLPKLVRAGQRVAICDQLEDPKTVKGIVKRGVTELVTPGVSFNDQVLEQKRNNYLASLHFGKSQLGIALLDASTGEFLLAQGDAGYMAKLLQNFSPAEVLFCKGKKESFFQTFGSDVCHYALDEWVYNYDFALEALTKQFNTASLKGFGVEALTEGITAAGAILHYLAETQHHDLRHISALGRLEEDKYVWLDRFTVRNLELIYPQHPEGVPLIDVLDHTITPMGGRLLRKWLVLPLKDAAQIRRRLDTVEALQGRPELLQDIQHYLKQISDLERLISKVAVRRVNPRELLQLARALEATLPIKELLAVSGVPALQKLADQLLPCESIRDEIQKTLKPDAPMLTNQGNMVQTGIDQELDELRAIAFSGKDYLLQIQQREIQNTGITSLKIAFNKVFGYYLEVTHAHKDKVPSSWMRKQTLVNAERYITEELKTYEEKILHAEDRLYVIEQRIFNELVLSAAEFVPQIQQNAKALGMLDCLANFAQLATQNNYVKPEVDESTILNITQGRHPVIEKQLPLGERYVPNDIRLDNEDQQVIIITGPNMAGKSALLRQTALIVLMAQIGSFVPAEAAQIGVIDKIFTRVGASDNLSRGESTFMVEMTETASILNNISDRSLVLMDEIGRGTSTYDGISIAWAIVEHLHNAPKGRAKTLFATHYHELNQLTEDFPRVRNYNVSVKESNGKILFMRKLLEGGSAHSFGIQVAQMAGMPNSVVIRANEIMHHLEQEKIAHPHQEPQETLKSLPKQPYQLSMFELNDPQLVRIKEVFEKLDINTITPVEALLKLNELKMLVDKK